MEERMLLMAQFGLGYLMPQVATGHKLQLSFDGWQKWKAADLKN
jgi:hypothetical protein